MAVGKLRLTEEEEVGGHGIGGLPELTGLRRDGILVLVEWLARAAALGEAMEERLGSLGFDEVESRLHGDESAGVVIVTGQRPVHEGEVQRVAYAIGAPAYPLKAIMLHPEDPMLRGATVPLDLNAEAETFTQSAEGAAEWEAHYGEADEDFVMVDTVDGWVRAEKLGELVADAIMAEVDEEDDDEDGA